MIIPFDQYQRYKTLGELIKRIKEQYNMKSFKILEIGANVQKNLEKFLLDDEIFYSDIDLPQELQEDSHCFIADATNLVNIHDDEYDIVIAADVFEHIPIDKRLNFISEINRVSKYAALICFPFLADHNIEAEKRVSDYFTAISGQEYRWLSEHNENGLPSLDQLNIDLKKLNINYFQLEHGNIKTWELMMKNHVFTCFAQDLILYREQIDKYYNEYLYLKDISNENYRSFYIMFKDSSREVLINEAIRNLKFIKSNNAEVDDKLYQFSQDIKDINELKLRLKVNEEAANIMNSNTCTITKLIENAFSIYFNYGNGYSEENKVSYEDRSLIDVENQIVKVKIPNDVLKIRIDPLEGERCIVYDLKIITNKGSITEYKTNAIYSGKYLIFNTTDPWIEFDITDEYSQLEIQANIILIHNVNINLALEEYDLLMLEEINLIKNEIQLLNNDKDLLYNEKALLLSQKEELLREKETLFNEKETLNNHKELLSKELEISQKENEKLCNQAGELNSQIDKLKSDILKLMYEADTFKNMYNNISNSFFWRCTKPFRLVTDILKKILKKNKITYKICRGLILCKKHGIKYCVKTKLINKKNNEDVIQQDDDILVPINETIKFSILVPLYNPNCEHLIKFIDSVLNQNYNNWELCLADGSNADKEAIKSICEEYVNKDNRIRYHALENNMGISVNTNECAKMASGDYYVLSDQDDVLHPHALYYNATAITDTDADVLYSDEDHLAQNGKHINVLHKPDWSIDLLYNQMYVCHLFVFKKALFDEVQGFRKEFDGSQDYDLMLRFSEKTDNICHIPRVLYSWRETENSTSINPDSKPYAHYAGKEALDSHLKRKYGEIAHAEVTDYLFLYEARFDLLKDNNKISIIIPMKDHYDLTNNCIDSILSKSTFANYEILIINNRSIDKETYKWFDKIQKLDQRIKVIDADFEFNWSKINNFAASKASGDIFVFLNNDTLIITPDWIERLCELSLREDVGIVGPMLLYDDDTIQHAGVVVGIGGWAEHIFKGMKPIHNGTPFVSPVVNRNVLAVTGACMCITRDKFNEIGKFDEEFIICGSDVELGIRAYEMGYNNIYDAHVRLYHLESKSRDSFIPDIDFKKSYESYTPYRENGDPYYNGNLDINSVQPKESGITMNLSRIKKHLANSRITAHAYKKARNIRNMITESLVNYEIPEVQSINYRTTEIKNDNLRLNILVPSVSKEHVFGGISTALKFFYKLGEKLECDLRIIITDCAYDANNAIDLEGYVVCNADTDTNQKKQLVPFGDRYNKSIPVRKMDVFLATGWWTAYNIADVIRWQNETYQMKHELIYFIQDYEPGFYPWSSRYLMADSTYKLDIPTTAIFNSKLLKNHFNLNHYVFSKEYYFEPTLNENLYQYLIENKNKDHRKNRILIYGRPNVQRNAFELIIYALNKWCLEYDKANEWEIISLGEKFHDIVLNNNMKVKSYGKVSLEEYAQIMLESKIGISLMVSPHPSYPPLEMSTFGIKTITNCYEHKDLGYFNSNIISLSDCSPDTIANKLVQLCDSNIENKPIITDKYCGDSTDFDLICEELMKGLLNKL